jgi:hypothetical protein
MTVALRRATLGDRIIHPASVQRDNQTDASV